MEVPAEAEIEYVIENVFSKRSFRVYFDLIVELEEVRLNQRGL